MRDEYRPQKHGLYHIVSHCAVLCLVTQSCLTLRPIGCSPPGSSVHGASPDKNTGVGCHALLQGIFTIQGLNLGLLHCRRIFYYQGSPRILKRVAYHFSKGSSQTRNQTGLYRQTLTAELPRKPIVLY